MACNLTIYTNEKVKKISVDIFYLDATIFSTDVYYPNAFLPENYKEYLGDDIEKITFTATMSDGYMFDKWWYRIGNNEYYSNDNPLDLMRDDVDGSLIEIEALGKDEFNSWRSCTLYELGLFDSNIHTGGHIEDLGICVYSVCFDKIVKPSFTVNCIIPFRCYLTDSYTYRVSPPDSTLREAKSKFEVRDGIAMQFATIDSYEVDIGTTYYLWIFPLYTEDKQSTGFGLNISLPTTVGWDWSTTSDILKAYDTIKEGGTNRNTRNFHHTVWNEMVKKTREVLTLKGVISLQFSNDTIIGADTYSAGTTYNDLLNEAVMPGGTDEGRTLTAKRFNALRFCIGSFGHYYDENNEMHIGSGILDQFRGNPVYGWYFIRLMDCLNNYLSD